MDDSYATGLIDGEGYIGLVESGGSISIRLKVEMTDKGLPALKALEQTYGGTIYRDRETTLKNRATHAWRMNGIAAAALIERLLPHFLVKRESALIALQFSELQSNAPRQANGNAKWTPEMRQKAIVLRSRIQEANRRGPDPTHALPTDRTPIARIRWGEWWELEEGLFGPIEYAGKIPTSGQMISGHIYPVTL